MLKFTYNLANGETIEKEYTDSEMSLEDAFEAGFDFGIEHDIKHKRTEQEIKSFTMYCEFPAR